MKDNLIIRILGPECIKDLVNLHLTELPNDPAAKLGREFLENILYPHLISTESIVFGALDANENLIGYLISGRKIQIPINRMFTEWGVFRSLKKIFISIKPQELISIFLLSIFPSKKMPIFELQYIVVSSSIKSQGVGSLLVSNLRDYLKMKNCKEIFVKTLAKTPQNVSFYKKNQFEHFKFRLGRVYLVLKI